MREPVESLYRIDFESYRLPSCYVVAGDPTTARDKAIRDLETRDIGYFKERVAKSITLIAENAEYPCNETRLYL